MFSVSVKSLFQSKWWMVNLRVCAIGTFAIISVMCIVYLCVLEARPTHSGKIHLSLNFVFHVKISIYFRNYIETFHSQDMSIVPKPGKCHWIKMSKQRVSLETPTLEKTPKCLCQNSTAARKAVGTVQ